MAKLAQTLVTSRPGKTVWAIAAICWTLFQLPFWLIYYGPTRLRQHPKWTYHQAISNRLLRLFLYHSSLLIVCTPLRLEPAVDKEQFITIKPAEKDVYRGVIADTPVRPAVTGGTWFSNVRERNPSHTIRVVLYFHGGAFVVGEGRSWSAFPGKILAENLNANVLSLSYRLSSNPGCQFPAALQDAVTAYQYLLDRGNQARDIIVAGDSCGGNLAVALLRYIEDQKDILPHPAAAVLCSPWLDLVSAYDPVNMERNRNYSTDYLPGNFTSWGANTYIPWSMRAEDPYISPLRHSFPTQTGLWICVGVLEILYDQAIQFVENMKEHKGNKVEIHIEPYANHAFLNVGNLTGFVSEAEHAMKLADEWVSENGT